MKRPSDFSPDENQATESYPEGDEELASTEDLSEIEDLEKTLEDLVRVREELYRAKLEVYKARHQIRNSRNSVKNKPLKNSSTWENTTRDPESVKIIETPQNDSFKDNFMNPEFNPLKKEEIENLEPKKGNYKWIKTGQNQVVFDKLLTDINSTLTVEGSGKPPLSSTEEISPLDEISETKPSDETETLRFNPPKEHRKPTLLFNVDSIPGVIKPAGVAFANEVNNVPSGLVDMENSQPYDAENFNNYENEKTEDAPQEDYNFPPPRAHRDVSTSDFTNVLSNSQRLLMHSVLSSFMNPEDQFSDEDMLNRQISHSDESQSENEENPFITEPDDDLDPEIEDLIHNIQTQTDNENQLNNEELPDASVDMLIQSSILSELGEHTNNDTTDSSIISEESSEKNDDDDDIFKGMGDHKDPHIEDNTPEGKENLPPPSMIESSPPAFAPVSAEIQKNPTSGESTDISDMDIDESAFNFSLLQDTPDSSTPEGNISSPHSDLTETTDIQSEFSVPDLLPENTRDSENNEPDSTTNEALDEALDNASFDLEAGENNTQNTDADELRAFLSSSDEFDALVDDLENFDVIFPEFRNAVDEENIIPDIPPPPPEENTQVATEISDNADEKENLDYSFKKSGWLPRIIGFSLATAVLGGLVFLLIPLFSGGTGKKKQPETETPQKNLVAQKTELKKPVKKVAPSITEKKNSKFTKPKLNLVLHPQVKPMELNPSNWQETVPVIEAGYNYSISGGSVQNTSTSDGGYGNDRMVTAVLAHPSTKLNAQRAGCTECVIKGNEFMSRGEFKKAENEYKKSLRITPNDGETRALLALVYHSMKKDHNAMREVFSSLKLQPDNPWALLVGGSTRQLQGDYADAAGYFIRYVSIKDPHPFKEDVQKLLKTLVPLARRQKPDLRLPNIVTETPSGEYLKPAVPSISKPTTAESLLKGAL
ncbi:MAG: tetratricopeptide repeat protein [Deltaproteobacteria bacterium]|nr:tetratricopeptide repeat protein [Deltaproteobacteria bacterium]